MNLLEIRQQFVRVSGRYDLVVDAEAGDWTDAGVNFFIQSGQLYLDQRIETKLSESVCYRTLRAGSVGCTLPDCRAIREVWVQDTSDTITSLGARYKLIKRSREYLRNKYPNPVSALTAGSPLEYYLPPMRIYPDNFTMADLLAYLGWADAPLGGSTGLYNGVVVLPPGDRDLGLEIIGLFYTLKLESDLDQNMWSIRYPNVLLWAAFREMEITYRNTEGAKDWENAINQRLTDIDKDNVEEDITDVSKMEG